MKKWLSMIALCLLPLSLVAYLFYSLETYNSVTHNECGASICMCSVIAFLISLYLWNRIQKTAKYATAIFIVSSLILCGVYYVGTKIPFCVICDGVTAEDLGFLTHWIDPMP